MVSLDLKKTFDKMLHSGLIYKLIHLNSQTNSQTFKSLPDKSYQNKINDMVSTTKPINASVPQGSCLSLHLFSLYINDMLQHPGSCLLRRQHSNVRGKQYQ